MTSDPKSFEYPDSKSKSTYKRINDFVEYNKHPHELNTVYGYQRPSLEMYRPKPVFSETSALSKSKLSDENTMKGDVPKNADQNDVTLSVDDTSSKGRRRQRSKRKSNRSKYGQFPEPKYQETIILKRNEKDASTLTVENSGISEIGDENNGKRDAATQVFPEPSISKLYFAEHRPGSMKLDPGLIDRKYSLLRTPSNASKSSAKKLKQPSQSETTLNKSRSVNRLSNTKKRNSKSSSRSSSGSSESETTKKHDHGVTDEKCLQPIYFIILPTKTNKSQSDCKLLTKMYSKNFLIPTINRHPKPTSKKKSKKSDPIMVFKDSSSSFTSSCNCECNEKSNSVYNVSYTCRV